MNNLTPPGALPRNGRLGQQRRRRAGPVSVAQAAPGVAGCGRLAVYIAANFLISPLRLK